MGKIDKPLLAFDAHGTIGRSITFRKSKGIDLAQGYSTPDDPETDEQIWRRRRFQYCNCRWNNLSLAEKEAYRPEATKHGLPSHAYYIQQCLLEAPPPVPPPVSPQTFYYTETYPTPPPQGWTNNPQFMVDGNLTTFAWTDDDWDLQYNIYPTITDAYWGTITQVEMRVYGYGDGDDEYRISLWRSLWPSIETPRLIWIPAAAPAWSPWHDITAFMLMTGLCTWAELMNVWTFRNWYHKIHGANPMYGAINQLRLHYTIPADPCRDILYPNSGW